MYRGDIMNEVISTESKQLAKLELPNKSIKKAIEGRFLNLSWEDIENELFYGQGLSKVTYKSYLQSTKLFAEFIVPKKENLLSVEAGDLEYWYDHLMTKNDIDTCRLRVAGVKNFFKTIQEKARTEDINWCSPFENMTDKLKEKLFSSKNRDQPLPPLTSEEACNLVSWLKSDQGGLMAKQNYALVKMFLTCGLRSAELLSLKWSDLDRKHDPPLAFFTGKGRVGKHVSSKELDIDALQAVEDVFRETTGKEPSGNLFLFYNIGTVTVKGQRSDPTRLKYQALYERSKRIGRHALEAGIISQRPDFTFSPHLFRRTFATELHNDGMSLASVSNQLGHKNISTTTKHYISGNESNKGYIAGKYA